MYSIFTALYLNHQHLGTQGHIITIVAIGALGLKHQVISSQSADQISVVLQCICSKQHEKLKLHFGKKHDPGSAFIKPDQRNPWIKDQIKITLLPTISHLLLPNFVSCGRACPSHMTQNLVTVGAKLWTADRFIVDPWSMDYADPVW